MLLRSFFLFLLIVEKKVINTMTTSISSPNYLGIFTAIIAAFGALTGAYFSYQSLNNSRKTLEQQKILGEQSIDANIIANARIKWIQEVRKLVSKIYSDLESFQINSNSNQLSESNEFMFKLNELLLYFGDDSGNQPERVNDGNNKKIIDMIDSIKESIRLINKTKSDLEKNIQLLKSNYIYIKEEEEKEYENQLDISGSSEEEDLFEYYYHEAYEQTNAYIDELNNYNEANKNIEELSENLPKLIESLEKETNNFSDTLRAYLKNEWKEITEKKK